MPLKITAAIARRIREARAGGKATKVLAHEYGISLAQVNGICVGRFWAEAGGPITNKRETPPSLSASVLSDLEHMSQIKCAHKNGVTLSKVKSIIKNEKLKNSA